MSVEVLTFDSAHPGDLTGLSRAIRTLGPARVRRLAVFMKLEGDYDDGSRERALEASEKLVAESRLADRTQVLLAVGCEGVATPFGYAVADIDDEARLVEEPRLAIGLSSGPPFGETPHEPAAAIAAVAHTVRAAIADAGLAASEVTMTFVKVPQAARFIGGSERVRGRAGRAIGALGAGVALGELDAARIPAEAIGVNGALFCRAVQAFSGPEVSAIQAIVLGNREGAGGQLVACATQTVDLIDARAIKRMLVRAGLALDRDGELSAPERVAAMFFKGGPSADGSVRGARTAIYGSAIPPEKHMRAAISGLLGGLLGTTRAFITGDPVHGASEGGAVACAIVRIPSGS